MFEIYRSLFWMDKLLVIGFILFSIYIIGAVYYVQHEIWGNNLRRALESFIVNLQIMTGKMEHEYYNSTWQKERQGAKQKHGKK